MSDTTLFQESNDTNIQVEPFTKRELIYILDQNNGNYNGSITFDTSPISNSGKYASFSEAYLEVPLVVTLQANTAMAGLAAARTPFAAALKNGSIQLIHSLQIEYNNVTVVQFTNYTNFHVSYKLMTSFSRSDLDKHGTGMYFFPDDPFSQTFNATAANTGTGNGVCNNTDAGLATASNYIPACSGQFLGPQVNLGLWKRQQKMCYDPGNTTTGAITFLDATNCNTIGKDYYVDGGVADNQACKVWYVMAKIHLKFLADFFDKLPLVKGSFIKLTLNTNTASHNLELTVAGGIVTNLKQTTAVITGGTTPIMFPSAKEATSNGGVSIGTVAKAAGNATYNMTYAVAIGKATSSITGGPWSHPTFSGCRLYCPLYTINPVQEEQYITLNRQKTITYTDIYQYQVTNIAASGSFNSLITNGISRPTKIVIIPFLNSGVTGQNNFSPWQSVFDSAPAQPSPCVALTNFNIQVAGTNMWAQNINYDFEQFTEELRKSNALNGGLTTGITSGLIDEAAFQHGYRYYVCDVSRRLPGDDVPKSIQIMGTNTSQKAIDLYVFVEFEKSITLDLISGAKVSTS